MLPDKSLDYGQSGILDGFIIRGVGINFDESAHVPIRCDLCVGAQKRRSMLKDLIFRLY
jgi:hypothetical protein